MGRWIKITAVLLTAAVLIWIFLGLGSGMLRLVSGADTGRGGRDPMFAEEAEVVTRPPEIYPEETQKPHKTLDDYVSEEESPVTKTAEELILEAQAQG